MTSISRRGLILLLASQGIAAGLMSPSAAAGGDPAESLEEEINDENAVTVTVKPLVLSETADAWRFEIRLNTHVTPLDQDLLQVASLSGDNGEAEPPLAWNGDAPGGHHRKGELTFKPLSPQPRSLTLDIRNVGGVELRSFTWRLSGT